MEEKKRKEKGESGGLGVFTLPRYLAIISLHMIARLINHQANIHSHNTSALESKPSLWVYAILF
jgi:hypothetical protein